jgi:hypothetical protein
MSRTVWRSLRPAGAAGLGAAQGATTAAVYGWLPGTPRIAVVATTDRGNDA